MTDKVLPVHFYHSPYGRHELIACTHINPEDHDYFLNNDIKVSMEELDGNVIAYGCPESDETEESEVVVFSFGQSRSCKDTLAELAKECKKAFGERTE